MFILDSLMISGIRWALETALTAAEAEMNDDSVLREQLLEAEMRREMGELSDEEFRDIEADLLTRIREIKERREGGAGPLAFSEPVETTGDSRFQVEASVSGDFYDPTQAPHTTVVESAPQSGEEVTLLDMVPGEAAPAPADFIETARSDRSSRSTDSHRSERSTRSVDSNTGRRPTATTRTAGNTRTSRATRRSRTPRTSRTTRTRK